MIMESLHHVPATVRLARAYVRYSPLQAGKHWLWDRLIWRRYRVRARTRFGTKMECHTGSSVVDRNIYYFGVWEPNITHWVQRSLSAGDVFVDIGAHIGYYTLLAAKLVGRTGKVVAVEAAPSTFQVLHRNIEMNNLDNVESINAAASAERGSLEIWGHYEDTGRTGVRQEDGRPSRGVVDAVPVQELVKEGDWSRTRLVKIDVEGYEPNVIAGMRTMIAGCREDCEFLVELIPKQYEEGELEDMLATFAGHGFLPYQLVNPYEDDYYLARRTDFGARRMEHPDRLDTSVDIVFSRRVAEHLQPTS